MQWCIRSRNTQTVKRFNHFFVRAAVERLYCCHFKQFHCQFHSSYRVQLNYLS